MVTWIGVNKDGTCFDLAKQNATNDCVLLYNAKSKLTIGCQVEQAVKIDEIKLHLEYNAIKVGDTVLDAYIPTDDEHQRIQNMPKMQWHIFSRLVHKRTGQIPRRLRWYYTTTTIMPSRRARYAMLVYRPSKELVQSWLKYVNNG